MKKLLSILLLASLTASAQFRISQDGANIAINNSITASGFGILNQSGTNMNVSVTNLLGMLNARATNPLQFGSANLTNWSSLATSAKQDAGALTNSESRNVSLLGTSNWISGSLGLGGGLHLTTAGVSATNAESAFGDVSADGVTAATFTGSGAGITNIPQSGVTGLTTALDWLTNNAGGVTYNLSASTNLPATGLADGTTGTGAFVRSTNATVYNLTSVNQTNQGTSSYEILVAGSFYPTNMTLPLLTNVMLKTTGNTVTNAVAGTDYVAPGFVINQTTGATNFLITFTNTYQKIIATNDVAFTNHSGIGAASIRLMPNGANRNVYFPTNWAWLSTNNLTLAGSQWRTTVTNGVSRVGWLSLVADGADATNVVATFTQTPQ